MARSEARIPTTIWQDATFTALTRPVQLLYFFLRCQPDLDAAGLIPLRPRRWAADIAVDMTAHLQSLETAGWVFTDTGTEELLASRFFAHERIAEQPRRAQAAAAAVARILSVRLRAEAARELGEALAEAPRAGGIRGRILERDGHRCQRCGWAPGDRYPLDERTGQPSYRAPEVDHILPRARGGKTTEANLQVLCSVCNASKGARV